MYFLVVFNSFYSVILEMILKKGDVVEWHDFDHNKKIGLVLDRIEDIIERENVWLYVMWPNSRSYIRSTQIKKLR